MGEVSKKSQPENNIPQPAIEHIPPSQPIEINEGVIYDTELENALKSMKKILGFLKETETRNVVGFGLVILFKH